MKRLLCLLAACGSSDPALPDATTPDATPSGAVLSARVFPSTAPTVQQNQTTVYQVNITNLGDAESGTISLDTDQTVLDPWGCGSLAPGAMCEFEVVTIPTTVGAFHKPIGVDAVRATRVEVALDATVQAAAAISIDPSELHFGATPIAIEMVPLIAGFAGELSLRNNSDHAIGQVTVANTNAPLFQASNRSCGTSLPAHSSCEVVIGYFPMQTPPLGGGNDTSTMSVSVDGQTLTVAVDGFGASLMLDPSSPANQLQVPDAYAGASGGTRTFTVKNTSNAAIGPLAVKLDHTDGSAATDLPISADQCTGATLQPFKTCTIAVGLAMASPGMAVGVLQVTAPSSTAQVNATGSELYGFAVARP